MRNIFTFSMIASLIAVFAVLSASDSSVGSITKEAERALALCAQAEDRALCYEKEVPALLDRGMSLEDAFAVTRAIQERDPEYTYCHVLAHNISARETAKDPSKWKDVVARSPSGVCGNGGLHGAFQERFRTDALPEAEVPELLRELEGVCDLRETWQPTLIERSSCFHGIGHLTMYITAADIPKSLGICELLARDESEGYVRTCFDGAFMQVFQPLEPEDIGLVEGVVPAPQERIAFCERFDGLARTSCIKESWPQVRAFLTEPAEFASFCASVSGGASEYLYCASGLAYVVFSMIGYDVDRMMDLCNALSEPLRGICVSRTASRFIETDWKNIPQALSVCEHASDSSREACYDELVLFAEQGLPSGSDEARSLCSSMPESWRSRCAVASGVTI